MDFTLYFDRRITECYFITNIVKQQNLMGKEDLSSALNMLINEINSHSDKLF